MELKNKKSSKTKWIFCIILAVLAVMLVLLFLRGNEDTWVKDKAGQWIRHGNPTAPAPESIPRIPQNTCPDKEFEGQGDGALYLKGKPYYTDKEDWEWIVNNCSGYAQYR